MQNAYYFKKNMLKTLDTIFFLNCIDYFKNNVYNYYV